jgi:hypothetical protein
VYNFLAINPLTTTYALLATNTSETAPWCQAFISHDCPANTQETSRLNWPGAASMYKKMLERPWCFGHPGLLAFIYGTGVYSGSCPIQILLLPLCFYPPTKVFICEVALLDWRFDLPSFGWFFHRNLRVADSRPTSTDLIGSSLSRFQ